MGIFDFFHDSDTEYHHDGSYTVRDHTTGSSSTYDSDGHLREYSTTEVPLIGPNRVDTYDSDGHLVNSQDKWD